MGNPTPKRDAIDRARERARATGQPFSLLNGRAATEDGWWEIRASTLHTNVAIRDDGGDIVERYRPIIGED